MSILFFSFSFFFSSIVPSFFPFFFLLFLPSFFPYFSLPPPSFFLLPPPLSFFSTSFLLPFLPSSFPPPSSFFSPSFVLCLLPLLSFPPSFPPSFPLSYLSLLIFLKIYIGSMRSWKKIFNFSFVPRHSYSFSFKIGHGTLFLRSKNFIRSFPKFVKSRSFCKANGVGGRTQSLWPMCTTGAALKLYICIEQMDD